MRATLVIASCCLAILLAGGCDGDRTLPAGNGATSSDGAASADTAAGADGAGADSDQAGSIPCDGQTCGPDEYCLIECLCCGIPVDAGEESRSECRKIPKGCDAKNICGCKGMLQGHICDPSSRTVRLLCA
jgi:hypothetical protein